MTDPSTPELPAATAPAATATETVSTPEGGSLIEQAVAVVKAARAEEEGAPAVAADPAAPVKEPEPVTPAAPVQEPPAAVADPDEKFAKLFARVSGIEAERQRERAEVEQLRAAAKRAEDYDQSFAAFKDDPEQLFKRVGWSPETISAYIKGEKAPAAQAAQMTAAERKLADMEAKLTALTTSLHQEREQAQVQTLRQQLPGLLAGPGATKYPTASTFFKEAPHEFADAVLGTVSASRTHGKELSYEEAAAAVENVISAHKKRFFPDSVSPGATSAPTSTKPAGKPAPTLTNAVTPAASSEPADHETESTESRMARAAAQIRALRAG